MYNYSVVSPSSICYSLLFIPPPFPLPFPHHSTFSVSPILTMVPTKQFLIAIITVLLLNFSPALGLEIEDEHEFSYDPHSERGPHNWGEIHKEWAVCGNGKMQSPIDLSDRRVQINPFLGKLQRSYRPATAVMKNRGHDIMLKWVEDAGEINIYGKYYALKQLHWHSPSEHTINGNRYSMEMHMVHESVDKKIAVVGILYKIGRPDPFLTEMEGYIKKIGDLKEAEVHVGIVDPRKIKIGSRNYYRYLGSLTTPPCTEGVIWTIIKEVRTVSKEQMELLKEAVHDDFSHNARPKQMIHDRTVELYRPPFSYQDLSYTT